MLPIKVGIVSKTPEVTFEEVSHVANALTMQVSRDFTPIWNVSASVMSYASASHVPAGSWPIFVVPKLPPGEGGFHWTKHKQPFAEVEAGGTWSLSASHELIEMLVDPSGNRLIAGPELLVQGGKIVENPQKQVEYLVEACDPCESADCSYLIEDVVVSDFFTPHFHDPVASAGTRYSFTGKLTYPRQVLSEGYISWSDPETGHLMQIQYFGQPKVIDLSAASASGSQSLREFVHTKAQGWPTLSKVPATHSIMKLRSTRREAIHQAAQQRSRAYER
jgi:hypothetical protein